MNCERALEILTSIKSRIDIICSREEIIELMNYSLVREFDPSVPIERVSKDLESLKRNYSQLNGEINKTNKELLSLEREYDYLSLFLKLISFLYIGRGRILKNRISKLKKSIENKNIQVSIIKDQILNLNDQRQSKDQSVRVNGKHVILTPIGDTIIAEIEARRRFLSLELSSLMDIINKLDDTFVELINNVGNLMKNSNFSAIWAVYMINIRNTRLAAAFNNITNKEYNYKTAEKRMMRLSVYALNKPDTIIPSSLPKLRRIQQQMRYDFRKNNPSSRIKAGLDRYRIYDSKLRSATTTIGRLFSSWTEHHPEEKMNGDAYYDALMDIFEKKPFGKLLDEVRYASFILPFVEDHSKFKFFKDQLKDVPEGSKFFSTVASLFPWDPEETWMVLLRAEKNILKAQSAKFLPELVEYALLITMNEKIIQIENNITEEYVRKWKNLIIPIVHLMTYSFLEKDLEDYIKRRPLAYIISPRYYYHSSLHYHVIG